MTEEHATTTALLLRAADTGDVTATAQSLADGPRVDGADEQGKTALMKAVIGGHIDIIEKLLRSAHGALDARCRKGWTALGYGISAGHVAVTQRLLTAGADTTNVNDVGDSALICAIRHSHRPIIELLLATTTPASVNAFNNKTTSALTLACSRNLPDVVEKLIYAGANVAHADDRGETGLMIATVEGFDTVVHALLSSRAHPPDSASLSAALSYAVDYGRVRIAQMLVAAGADVNHKNRYGFRPLIAAAQAGRADLVRLLLRAGADVNLANHRGDTALSFAAWNGCTEVVELMLAVDGIEMEHSDEHGDTALMCAVDECRVDAARILIIAGANVHHANRVGETALMRACRRGQCALVDMLLELGVDVDGTTRRRRWTALLFASQCGSVAIVERLLSIQNGSSARIQHVNDAGESALVLAAHCGHTPVVDMLLAHGALVDHAAINGTTALLAAAASGHADAVTALLTAGADASKTNYQGVSPLFGAIENGDKHVVTMLLASGVDANATSPHDPSLYAPARRRRPAMLECLRASNTVDLDRWTSLLT